ncbi:motile sperm domain-containing protein 3 isoform X2 [Apodemus sylvaticus]|uniref:motile sperm domain-containing protein 3 isoform X2 n=1 Tax=Apodemus sylvaticus TaxID=10129 RepID=UPI0022435A91|nr:motile sperm domain-containing protein 3 isoform X2 [Apodemus sylvaticus]
MRRGAPQDQELVGPGAPGRGSRGSPPSSGPVVPVLVFPPDLVFRADQRSGPRQLLTLYNPTGTALRFRVLCTAPAKYTVFDAEGYVKPQSCIDIVIRHVAPIPSHYDVQDRFRIELSEDGAEGRVVGRKDITSVLRAPAYPLELQGHSEPTPNPGPPTWTGPTPARHLQERHSHSQTPTTACATHQALPSIYTGAHSISSSPWRIPPYTITTGLKQTEPLCKAAHMPSPWVLC